MAASKGDQRTYLLLIGKAADVEAEAAYALLKEWALEPTRSILFRSAATMSIQADKLVQACSLTFAGLSGSPPKGLAAELEDVLHEIAGKIVKLHEVSPTNAKDLLAAIETEAGSDKAAIFYRRVHFLLVHSQKAVGEEAAKRDLREADRSSPDSKEEWEDRLEEVAST